MPGRLVSEHFDLVDVDRDRQPQDRAQAGADDAEQQAVAEEDRHDAAVGGAQRLEDADVAGFFHDDHGEDRQDAEAGDADDEEQQHVEHALLDGDGGQQRPLLVLPGVDPA